MEDYFTEKRDELKKLEQVIFKSCEELGLLPLQASGYLFSLAIHLLVSVKGEQRSYETLKDMVEAFKAIGLGDNVTLEVIH